MGIFEKIKNGLSKTRKSLTGIFDSFTGANDEFFDELEETLITADLGVDLAVSSVDQLRDSVKEEGLRGAEEIRGELARILTARLHDCDSTLHMRTTPSIASPRVASISSALSAERSRFASAK